MKSPQYMYTKMNSALKSICPIKPKTTPLAAQIIFGGPNLKTQAATWGIQNGQVALKMFYSKKLPKHNDLKIENCDVFLHENNSYIAASPNGIANCKCHGKTLIQIKYPFNIRNKTIQESVHECFFLPEKDGALTLLRTHRYYTQIISQMGVTGIHSCYFIVWTLKDISVQIVNLMNNHRTKLIQISSYFISHLYVQRFLLLDPLPIVETVIMSFLKRAK